LSSYSFEYTEQYEGVLANLINPDANLGDGKIHIVEENADDPSNFSEFRVGRDPFDPTNGSRVLTARSGFGSQNVSFYTNTNDTNGLNVKPILVSDTMNMDTLRGIIGYSFSNMKLLPRNNADFIGINVQLEPDTITGLKEVFTTEFGVARMYPNPAQSNVHFEVEHEGTHTLMISALDGKEVFRRETTLTSYDLGLEWVESGTYIVTVSDENGVFIDRKKLVVE
jgi:hypothetical protein